MLFNLNKLIDSELQDRMLEASQSMYAKYGYTTAQEGRATSEGYEAMKRASKKRQADDRFGCVRRYGIEQ